MNAHHIELFTRSVGQAFSLSSSAAQVGPPAARR